MGWFSALYSMAAIFMIIDFLWKFAVIPISIAVLIFPEKMRFVILFIVALVPYYLMASFAALVGIGVGGDEKSISVLVIGGIYLLFNGLLGIGNAMNEAEKQNDYQAYKFALSRYAAVILGLAYYTYAIFNIQVTINGFTMWLYGVMQWIQGIPIVGWIIAIVALLYVLNTMFMAVLMTVGLVSTLFNREKSVSV